MRLIVARCEVTYTGRLNAFLPESTRLLMLKDDGSVLVHADAGGYKPLNWMTPPTVIEEQRRPARRPQARRPQRGSARDQLVEVLSDVEHEMGEAAALEKDGVERDLQLLLADDPRHRRGPAPRPARMADRRRPRRPDVPRRGRRLGRRRDQARRHDRRRRAARALPRLHPRRPVARRLPRHPRRAADQAAGASRSPRRAASTCVEVDLAVLRGEREPELTLFAF